MTAPRIPRATMRHAAAWPEPFEHDSIAHVPIKPRRELQPGYADGFTDGYCHAKQVHRFSGVLMGMTIGAALVSAALLVGLSLH